MKKLFMFRRTVCLAIVMAMIGGLMGIGGVVAVTADDFSLDNLDLDGIFGDNQIAPMSLGNDITGSDGSTISFRDSSLSAVMGDTLSIVADFSLQVNAANVTMSATVSGSGVTLGTVQRNAGGNGRVGTATISVNCVSEGSGTITLTAQGTGSISATTTLDFTVRSDVLVIDPGEEDDDLNPGDEINPGDETPPAETEGIPNLKVYAMGGKDSVKVGESVTLFVTYYDGSTYDESATVSCVAASESMGAFTVGAGVPVVGAGKKITLRATKAGAVRFTVSCGGLSKQVILTATESEQVKYFGAVTTIEVAPSISGNFYNAGGLYIEQFTAKPGSNNYAVTMDVYNTKNMYGAVCVYDKDGVLTDVKPIEPHNSYTAMKYSAARQAFETYDVSSAALLQKYAYSNSKISTRTKLTLEVPTDGYIEITNDVSCRSTASLMAYLYNAMDLTVAGVFYGASTLSGITAIDVNAVAVHVTTEKVVESIWKSVSKKSLETLKSRLSLELPRDIAYTSIAQMIKSTRYILEENKISLAKIISDSALAAQIGINVSTVTTALNQQLDNAFRVLFALSNGGVTYADLAATIVANPANRQNILLYTPVTTDYRTHNGVKASLANGKPFDIGVMLVTEQITNIDFSKETFAMYGGDYKVFDIFLYKNDSYYIAPSNVEVRVPVPNGYNKSTLKVYHQNTDGNWDKISCSLDGNYIVISTDEFSLFAIVNDTIVQQFFVGTTVLGSGSVQGGGWYEIGDTVRLQGVSGKGYELEGWYENGKKISSSEVMTFTAGSDRAIEAKFIEQRNTTYMVTLNAGTGGTTQGGGVYNIDSSVTVIAVPNQFYTFDGWYDGTVRVSTNPSYTFKLTSDKTLTSKFLYNPTGGYIVTVTPTAGGVAYGGGWYNLGDTAALIAIPYTGYEFDGWYETRYENNKESAVKVWTEKTYNFTASANRTLNAVFKAVGTDLDKDSIYSNNKAIDISTINTALDSYTIEVAATDGVAYATIPVTALNTLTEKTKNHKTPFVINVDSNVGTYTLPLNLTEIVGNFNEVLTEAKLKPEEVSFKLIISDRTNEKAIMNALASDVPFAEVVGSIVDFSIEIIENKTGKTVADVTEFTEVIERVVPIARNIMIPERYGVLRYKSADKTFEYVPHSVSRIGNTENIVISSKTNGVFVIVDNPVEFSDLDAKHWAKPYINKASSKKLVQGMGNNKYDPERAVTRAEFVQMIVNALQLPAAEIGTRAYTDVNKNTLWYYNAIMKAKSAGLLSGFLDSYFYPDTAITREEMATILAAVVRQYDVTTTREAIYLEDLFTDYKDMSKPYLRDIELVYRVKLMNGMGDGMFGAQGNTTRAQAATVQIRLLELLKMIDK